MQPITSEKQYQEYLKIVNIWIDSDIDPEQFIDKVISAIEKYEDKNYPISLPSPIDAIKFRMDQMGLSQNDLVQYIGSKSKVSEVLNKKRKLSLKMIRSLYWGLGISLEILIQDY